MTHRATAPSPEASEDMLSLYIGGHVFGLPILQIHDVLRTHKITPVPLSAPDIEGTLNLRGRIVTALDMRTRLGLPAGDAPDKRMSVVVEHEGELFSLMVDKVGDVLRLDKHDFESVPKTLDPLWRDVALGIYKLDGTLLVILDIAKLLHFEDAYNVS